MTAFDDGPAVPDLRVGAWMRDFALLGGGVAAVGPGVVLGIGGWFGAGGIVVLLAISAGCGAVLGLGVGAALNAVTRRGIDHPRALLFLGFPAGFACGALVGWGLGGLLHPSVVAGLTAAGGITGGTLTGLTWVPYLGLKLLGRSGLAVVVVAVVLAGVIGPIALFAAITLTG